MAEAANPRLDMSHETAAQAQDADAASPPATLRSAALHEVEVVLREAQEQAHSFIQTARDRAGRSPQVRQRGSLSATNSLSREALQCGRGAAHAAYGTSTMSFGFR